MTEHEATPGGETGDQIVDRASVGARLLTARGFGMRIISVASTFALVALVRPADLGLLAVVRGLTALAGSTTELGFAWALLRREQDPSREEYAALAGVQLSIVALWIAIAALFPSLLIEIASVPAESYPWMMAVLVTTLLIPFGTNAKIRVERSLNYRRVAFYDLSSVLLLNLTLLGFALAGQFTIGVFVATAAMIIYTNSLLWYWSPGPMPSFRLGPWRRLAGDFAGFSAAHLCFVLYQSATPVVVANLFGLATAGIWSFATRLGNVLQVAFEGFRRASVPAAARLTRDAAALRRLAEESLEGTARLTIPMTGAMIAGLPVIAWLWPQWQPAVEVGQLYVLGYGLSGMYAASLTPVAVAVRGSRVALGEQLAPMAVGWIGFLILNLLGSSAITWVILPMFVALAITTWRLTPTGLRPGWNPRLGRNLIALLIAMAITAAGRALHLHPLVTAILAGLGFLAIGWRVLLPVRFSRTRERSAEPAVPGVASEPG